MFTKKPESKAGLLILIVSKRDDSN